MKKGYKMGKKRKPKNNNYPIDIPMQAGIHDTYKSGLSRNIGTSVHVGYLHTNDERRHKTRCIYYNKSDKLCYCGKSGCYMIKCCGSSHCTCYSD